MSAKLIFSAICVWAVMTTPVRAEPSIDDVEIIPMTEQSLSGFYQSAKKCDRVYGTPLCAAAASVGNLETYCSPLILVKTSGQIVTGQTSDCARYACQLAIIARRLSSRSDRAYARSTASPTLWANAASATSHGTSVFS